MPLYRFLCLALLIVGLGVAAFASEPSTVSGVVVDTDDERISGATVQLQRKGSGMYSRFETAKEGEFRFERVDDGEYDLVVSAPGYTTSRTTITAPTIQTFTIEMRQQNGRLF